MRYPTGASQNEIPTRVKSRVVILSLTYPSSKQRLPVCRQTTNRQKEHLLARTPEAAMLKSLGGIESKPARGAHTAHRIAPGTAV